MSEPRAPLGEDRAFSLRVAQRYRIAQRLDRGWEVQTTAYSYWLQDRHGHELVLYQWVPQGASPVTAPHLHIRVLAHPDLPDLPLPLRTLLAQLVRAHLPSGHVTLAEILRMTVADLGVVPLEDDAWKVASRLRAAQGSGRASLAWQIDRG